MDAEEIMAEQTVFRGDSASASDPIWVDTVWLDTVVVVGLTCFILCLMGLSKVRPNKGVVLFPYNVSDSLINATGAYF